MRLDADEIIEPDLAEEIRLKLPAVPPDVTGINLNRKTIFQGKFIRWGGRYPLTLLRIWRRGKARIEDRWMDEHMYSPMVARLRFKADSPITTSTTLPSLPPSTMDMQAGKRWTC